MASLETLAGCGCCAFLFVNGLIMRASECSNLLRSASIQDRLDRLSRVAQI
jgi:hypothetical protein